MATVASLFQSRLKIANALFDKYDFGPSIQVIGKEGGYPSIPTELVLVFYFQHDDDIDDDLGDIEDVSHRAAFHVRFAPDSDMPLESFALDLETGAVLGSAATRQGSAKHEAGNPR